MPRMVDCGECFYFEPLSKKAKVGECHRHPPRVMLDVDLGNPTNASVQWRRPQVKETDWCGDGEPTSKSLGWKIAKAFRELEGAKR